jgi:hypothetical protein
MGAIVFTDDANALGEEGKLFNFEYTSTDVDIASPIKILFKTGAKRVKYRTDVSVLGSTVKIDLYSGPTMSANGTEIVPVKYNPTVATGSPLLKIYHTPNVSNNGTLRYTRNFLGWSQGATSVGLSKTGTVWRTLEANSVYLAILTPAADNTLVTYGGDFFEV